LDRCYVPLENDSWCIPSQSQATGLRAFCGSVYTMGRAAGSSAHPTDGTVSAFSQPLNSTVASWSLLFCVKTSTLHWIYTIHSYPRTSTRVSS